MLIIIVPSPFYLSYPRLEKLVSVQLLNFLENNKYLSNCQHAFRPNLSTESAALTVVTDAIYLWTTRKYHY